MGALHPPADPSHPQGSIMAKAFRDDWLTLNTHLDTAERNTSHIPMWVYYNNGLPLPPSGASTRTHTTTNGRNPADWYLYSATQSRSGTTPHPRAKPQIRYTPLTFQPTNQQGAPKIGLSLTDTKAHPTIPTSTLTPISEWTQGPIPKDTELPKFAAIYAGSDQPTALHAPCTPSHLQLPRTHPRTAHQPNPRPPHSARLCQSPGIRKLRE